MVNFVSKSPKKIYFLITSTVNILAGRTAISVVQINKTIKVIISLKISTLIEWLYICNNSDSEKQRHNDVREGTDSLVYKREKNKL